MIEKTPDPTVSGQSQDSGGTIITSAIPGKRVIQEILEDIVREIESRRFQKLETTSLSEMRDDLGMVRDAINSDALLSEGQQNLVLEIIHERLENAVGYGGLGANINDYGGISDLVVLINTFRG